MTKDRPRRPTIGAARDQVLPKWRPRHCFGPPVPRWVQLYTGKWPKSAPNGHAVTKDRPRRPDNCCRRDQLLPENEEHGGRAGAARDLRARATGANRPRPANRVAAHACQPGSILSMVRPWRRAESKGHAMPELPGWLHLTDGTLWGANRAPSRHGRRWMLLVAPAVGLALVTAACGGGSPNAGVASVGRTTTTTTTAARAGTVAAGGAAPGGALVEYARCMRSHGVTSFPEPGDLGAPNAIRAFKGQIAQSVGALASSPTFRAAQRACDKYYGPPTTSAPQVSAQEMQKLLAVAHCMRAHGVPDFPDPNPITGEMNPPANVSRNSPIVLAALRSCTPLARAAGLGPPSTGQ